MNIVGATNPCKMWHRPLMVSFPAADFDLNTHSFCVLANLQKATFTRGHHEVVSDKEFKWSSPGDGCK